MADPLSLIQPTSPHPWALITVLGCPFISPISHEVTSHHSPCIGLTFPDSSYFIQASAQSPESGFVGTRSSGQLPLPEPHSGLCPWFPALIAHYQAKL